MVTKTLDSRPGNPENEVLRFADTVIVGGGTAGAAVAGLLAEESDESVLLLEAGPDYGPLEEGRWPSDLTDARTISNTHDWGYDSGNQYPGRCIRFERARVLGGCSAINGCIAAWGSSFDYDGWAEALNTPAWSAHELLPFFQRVSKRLHVRRYLLEEITPFQKAWLLAAPDAGIPSSEDLNSLSEDVLRQVEAGRVVLAAGTYGSPAILLRSGIGEPAALKHLGIATTHELPGVGKNLHDHSSITISFSGTRKLERLTTAFSADHWAPEEQVIAKVRSPHCLNAFDLHLYPIGGSLPNSDQWHWKVGIACMTPQSRGSVALRSSDPREPPIIDHRFLSDAEGQDQQVLVEGIDLARQITRYRPLSQLLGEELPLSGENRTNYDLSGFVKKYFTHSRVSKFSSRAAKWRNRGMERAIRIIGVPSSDLRNIWNVWD